LAQQASVFEVDGRIVSGCSATQELCVMVVIEKCLAGLGLADIHQLEVRGESDMAHGG
jgi:hypothetical protein